jgi:putative ABC transport system permease protein
MRGWMLAGLRRRPGPVLGTLVAATTAATLSVAAASVALAHTSAPLGRLAAADVVVAGSNKLSLTTGSGQDAQVSSVPLSAYRGVPIGLAGELAKVPGVASAVAESGFPDGTVRLGDADLIAVKADPGVGADLLAARITTTLHGGAGYTIATGAARGDLADPSIAVERANSQGLSIAVIPILIMTSLFVLAATTALSIGQRRARFALLRAIGAKRGQVRSAVLVEQAMIAVAGGALGFLPGTALGKAGVRALVSHGMMPAGSSTWLNPWLLLIACGGLLPVCVSSGLVAAWRAGRTSPARAVREVHTERRRPNPIRMLLGLAAAGGVVTLDIVSLHQGGPGAEIALAAPLLMCGMLAVALLGPTLVSSAAALIRPLQGAGPGARLALANARMLPGRTASAVVPVALAVGMISAIGFSNTTIAHASAGQSAQAVVAEHVLEGRGLDDAALGAVGSLPGATAAAGISPLSIAVEDPDLESQSGVAVAGGPISRLLDLDVVSGSLDRLGPGQIAISELEASSGVMGVHLGSKVTVYLPDGTPYPATVSAVYARSLAVGDLLVPESAAAGHTGNPVAYGQVLVDGVDSARLDAFAAAHPGVQVADRQVYNAQVQQNDSQNGYGNDLILGVIAALAAITMVNTLIVATLERRRQIRLLSRIGATRRQLAAMFSWQAVFVIVGGIVTGAAVGAGTLTAVDRASTGSAAPYVPLGPAALIAAGIAVLTIVPIMATFRVLARRE